MSQPPFDPYAEDARPGEPMGAAAPRPSDGGNPQEGGYPHAFGQEGPGRRSGGFFPFPHRTWQTRGGSQVTVGGCCLPLPLGCLTTVAAAGTVLAVKAVQARR